MRSHRARAVAAAVLGGALLVPLLPTAAPAAVGFTTTKTWDWAFTDLASPASTSEYVQAQVSGLTDKDKNAALVLRKSSTGQLVVNLSGTRYQVWTVRSGVWSTLVDVARPAGASGTARAEVSGTTVRMLWNGAVLDSRSLSATSTLAGTGTGLGIWQNAASAVTLSNVTTGALGTTPPPPPPPTSTTSMAVAMYGTPASKLPWHSGFWTGGYASADHIARAAAWRGSAMDMVTTYTNHDTWAGIANSEWNISTFDGFKGHLSLGLAMLPDDRRGQWGDVTSGAHDDVFRTLAGYLVAHGRGDAAVRVGLEANGDWFPWAVSTTTAPQYRAAFRRIVTVMRSVAPKLTFWEDLSAGTTLSGTGTRIQALADLYAGDDVVSGISIDHYDFYGIKARTDAEWANALRPSTGVGLQDAVDFARAKGKGFAVPEWGLHSTQGYGDNPFFMKKMFGFFQANKDVLVYENYFNEPDPYIANALFDPTQLPLSAAVYQDLWTP